MKFRNIPTIISLISGFVVAIFTVLNSYTIDTTLVFLAIVMLMFYIVGLVIKIILNKAFEPPKKPQNEEQTEDGQEEEEQNEGTASPKEK